jgi:hypothetical protein
LSVVGKIKENSMSNLSKKAIATEFARRAKKFNNGVNPMYIELWGLFQWGEISKYIKTKEIIPNKGYSKIHRRIWCKPSQAFFNKWINPILKFIEEFGATPHKHFLISGLNPFLML